MSALELLCDLCSLGADAKFRGASYDRETLTRLAAFGFVRDAGVLDAIACPLCGSFEDADVDISAAGPRILCSHFGWRPVAIDRVTVWIGVE